MHIKNIYRFLGISLIIFLWGNTAVIQAQNSPSYSKTSILEPTLFAPGVISTDAQEWDITFEPDGRTAYFTRRVKGERQKIYVSRFVDGKWTKAEVAPFSTNVDENAFITSNGKRFFFSSLRTLPESEPVKGYDTNIWVMERSGDDWGKPKPLAGEINTIREKGQNFPTAVENGAFIGTDGTLYYWSKNPDGTDSDIFEANFQDGKYIKPKRLSLPLNTDFWESYPAISPDGKYMIFNAYGRPDGFGVEDLYISYRLPTGWSYPRNLGEKVNGKYDDNFARFSPDGRYLFFSSNRPKEGKKERDSSIYFIETKALDLSYKPIPKPEKFVPDTLSSKDFNENSLSFSPDGKTALFSRYKDDWQTQVGYFSDYKNGKWSKPEKVPFADTLYNSAFSNDGRAIIFSKRNDDKNSPEVFLTNRTEGVWSQPISLSKKYGIRGGYFTMLRNKTLYFQREGEIYRSEFKDGKYLEPKSLGENINTPKRTEFSQFVNEEESLILFARYTEGDKSKTGLFLSRKDEDGNWDVALKLPLPYGWSPTISSDGKNLVYTIDEDIFSIPLEKIGLGHLFSKSENSSQVPRFEKSECALKIPKDENVDCGYLVVLKNRQKKESKKTIRLPIIIMKASSPNPEPDPILYTAGGPGASSLRQVNARRYIPYLKKRDYILFEQRGTKYAQPALECPEINDAYLEGVKANLDSERSVKKGIEAAKKCRDRLTEKGIDLSAYNSAESAADIEDLRKVLGYKKWNLYGVSYSTRLMFTVMRDYPQGIRSVLLDSAFPIDINYDETSVQSVSESAKKLFKTCKADTDCNKAYPKLEKLFYKIVKKANQKPFMVEVKVGKDKELTSVKVTGIDIANEIYGLLNTGYQLSRIPQFIYKVSKGDKEVLERIAKGKFSTSSLAWGMRYSHWCSEEMPFQKQKEIIKQSQKYKGFKGFQTQPVLQNVCKTWNVKPKGKVENKPVKSSIPTLIIAGKYDPNTPPKWGKRVSTNLTNSFFYELSDMSHVPTFGSNCAVTLADEFFDNPNQKPTTNCSNELPPIKFKTD